MEAATSAEEDEAVEDLKPGERVLKLSKKNISTLLVQLGDNDFDIGSDRGTIGRMHANGVDHTLLLEMAGKHYRGSLFPMATCFSISLTNDCVATVDAVMNEFCPVTDRKDVMQQLQGVVLEGNVQS